MTHPPASLSLSAPNSLVLAPLLETERTTLRRRRDCSLFTAATSYGAHPAFCCLEKWNSGRQSERTDRRRRKSSNGAVRQRTAMAQAEKCDLHKISSLKGESPAREGNGAIRQKPFARHNKRHHRKTTVTDPPLTTLLVKDSDPAYNRRENLPTERPKDSNSGSLFLVNIDGQPPFIILQGGQMTPIHQCSGSTYSLVPYSNTRDRSMKRSYDKSKQGKPGKITPRGWLQDKNDSSTLVQNDSMQDNSEVVDDGDTRSNKSSKKNPRKKGKKKGKHSKVSTQHDVSKEKEAVLEDGLHGMPTVQTTVNNASCSTDVSENISSHTSISSCLSVQLLNDKPEGEEYSYKQIEYIGSPSPMATSNSDEMTEMEPTTSFSEEFICDDYRYTLEGCMEHSSNQTCSPNTEQTDMVPSATSKSSRAFSNQSSSCDDTACSYYSGQDTIPVSELLVDEWGSDISSSYHANSMNQHLKNDRFSPADSQIDFHYPRTSNLLDIDMPVSESSVSCDRVGYAGVSEACSLSKACTPVSQRFIPGKRGRHGRKSGSSCNSSHWSGNQANLSKVGKDGGHSIWQRVEKKDVESCIPSRNMKDSSSGSDLCENSELMKNKPFLMSHLNANDNTCNISEIPSHSHALSMAWKFGNTTDFHQKPESANLSSNLPRRVKKHPTSLKQDLSQYSRKVPHLGKQNTVKHAVAIVQQNEATGKPSDLGCEKCELSDPQSFCKTDNEKSDLSWIGDVDVQRLEETEGTQITATTLELSYSGGKGTTAKVGKDQCDTSAREDDLWQRQYGQNVQFEGGNCISYKEDNSGFYQHYLTDSVADTRTDTRSSHLENSKHDYNSGVIMQKWVPVGKKGSSMSNRDHHDNPSVTHKDLHLEKGDFNNMHMSNQGFHCDSSFSTATSVSKCTRYTYIPTAIYPNNNDDDEEGKLSTVTLPPSHKLNDENNNTMKCNPKLGAQEVDNFKVETDMQKIVQAVTNACKFQNASELFNLQVGSPVAEFERVMYSASPVISQMRNVALCKSCSSDWPVCNPLCPHQIPNVSLQSIWRWYEKPGSYGLEVKVGDQHPKKHIANQSRFRAYFVPYLSAIQLFGISSGKSYSSCKADKLTNAPMLSALPVFSLLLPQPDKKLSELSPDPPSLLEEDDFSDLSLNKTKDDGELLFEYFESDPPQQRRPLFEKIRELVRGEISTSNKVFGDPSILESLNLHDIHPASWFSVAWYPIYRIPDGNFRAAFLTYHSLGTFVHRNTESTLKNSCDVVSPVVGLQSYNAKGECWFQLNESESLVMTQSEEHVSNPSYVLQERLRSLEQTASVMARASVSKKGQKMVNRQPDYEFFLSRRW